MNIEHLSRRLTSEEINELPLWNYSGNIVLIRSNNELQNCLLDLSHSEIVGFDTETRPTFSRGKSNSPALVQMATESCVYLLQLTWLQFGKKVAEILENQHIIKAGIGIADDMSSLKKLYKFTPANIVDLGQVARKHNICSNGLRSLSALFFGLRISKGQQCSNWSMKELSARQISYAATDAWMSRQIFLKMREYGFFS